MKLFIVSNTLFGYKKITENQFSYFNNMIIPYIKNNYKDGDIFIHGGNIFNTKRNISFSLIHQVMDIFEKISEMIPVYLLLNRSDIESSLIFNRIKNVNIVDKKIDIDKINLIPYNDKDMNFDNDVNIFNIDYISKGDIFDNVLKESKINICTSYDDNDIKDNNIINLGSPYQLNNEQKNKKGFIVLDVDKKKIKFNNNDISPKYISYEINSIEDLETLQIDKKDFINLDIDKSLIKKKENINKLSIFINKYNINKINYINEESIDDEEVDEDIQIDTYDIKDIVNKYLINNHLDLIEEFKNIEKIKNKTS